VTGNASVRAITIIAGALSLSAASGSGCGARRQCIGGAVGISTVGRRGGVGRTGKRFAL
jgi:hypothetical protein